MTVLILDDAQREAMAQLVAANEEKSARLVELLDEVAVLRKRVEELEGFAANVHRVLEARISDGMRWMEDHACAECVPHGDIVVPGFLCVRHKAAALTPKGASDE